MKTIRKAQESDSSVREAFKKRCRARRSSASSPATSPSVADSDYEIIRRHPRPPQFTDNASCEKDDKSSTSSTASSNEESSAPRSRTSAESCTLSNSGPPKWKNIASYNAGRTPLDGPLQALHYSGPSSPFPEESHHTNTNSRNETHDDVVPPDRVYHHAIIVEATTSESLQESHTSDERGPAEQRRSLTTLDKEKFRTALSIPGDRQDQQPPRPASNGISDTCKNEAILEVLTGKCQDESEPHKQAPPATLDEGGQTPQKRAGSANVLHILLSKQLPSCTTSALSILESRLRKKFTCAANGTCGAGKPVVEASLGARQEAQSEDEGCEDMQALSDERPVLTTDEATESIGLNCCSSNPSTPHLQTAPPLYYSVLTSNGLHAKRESVGTTVCLEEQVDHDTYPVVKGVSRDNTKKRWAVYWKGSRKYFYDKCYADCYQAYLSAVEFRRQAKACNAPGPPPKRPALHSEFYLSAPTSSLRFASYSPGIASFPTAPSTPPAFSTRDGPSPCTAMLGNCGLAPVKTSAALLEHQVGSAEHSELSVSFNEKEAGISRCVPEPSISSPTTADSSENVTDTVQVYRCAVIILLQDLLYDVLPPRIATLGPARRAAPSEPPLKARAEERFLSASLLLLQRTLQGHISKAERGGEEDLTQLLSILMPSLDRQLLPSELPRELQQTMLLQLTTLRL